MTGGASAGRDERGASAIILALAMLVMLGFAALAVDSGLGFGDRRQQQSAADVGALAAVQFARTGLPATHPDCTGLTGTSFAACRGAEEVLSVAEGTLPGRYTDADWDTCVDAAKPADFIQSSHISDCISFTQNLQYARVVLPGSNVDTAFGKILGVDQIAVSASAEASFNLDIVGGVLPFAVGPSGASSDQACFFAQSTANLDIYPCEASTQGNFGKLSLHLYGNDSYGTPQFCSGENSIRMATNIVTGSDHPLEPASRTSGTVNDDVNCPAITNPVDEVETWTGNAAGAIADGLFYGIATPDLEGRLLCKGGLSTQQSREDYPLGRLRSLDCESVNTLHPEALDHTPLWDYIRPGATGETAAGGTCTPGGGVISNRAEMETCIDGWKNYGPAHSTWLFRADIATSPRFGAVPILGADPGGGFSAYSVIGFLPVYLETIYFKCNANSCDTVHSAGEPSSGPCPTPISPATSSCGWPAGGNMTVEAITAFILSLDMLPPEITDRFPYTEGTLTFNLHR
jgi:hypothetical protein